MSTDAIDAEFRPLAVPQDAPPAMFGTDDPVEVVQRAVRVADALKAVIVAKGLVANIQGKQYPQVEAWQTLAAMLRLTSFTEWTREVEGGWEARVVVKDASGRDIGSGEAQCTRDERSWKSRDAYALRSMAQTRATSKALRSVLAFIMVLAGYQPTPADEVPPGGFDDARKDTPPPRAPQAELLALAAKARIVAADLSPIEAIAAFGAWAATQIAPDLMERKPRLLTDAETVAAKTLLLTLIPKPTQGPVFEAPDPQEKPQPAAPPGKPPRQPQAPPAGPEPRQSQAWVGPARGKREYDDARTDSPKPGSMSPKQQGLLFTLLDEQGFLEREARHAFAAEQGVTLPTGPDGEPTFSGLSAQDASRLIDALA